MMSYAKCLHSLSCNITNRGKKVYKHAAIGLIAGAASGAALGGLITGCRYGVIQNFDVDYRSDHYKEYGCTYDNAKRSIQCPDQATKDRLWADSYSYKSRSQNAWLDNVVPWLMGGLTIGGAALGLIIGICGGYCGTVPEEESANVQGKYNSLV